MRTFILLVTLIFLFCSCNDTGQSKVQPTDTLKANLSSLEYSDTASKGDTETINKTELTLDTLPNISLGKMTLVSSGQMSPYTTIKIDGCDFDLVANETDTTYLATNDKKFQTPEGYKVGTKFSELPKNIQGDLTKEPGWGYYYKLPSGWTLGFCEGNSCTDNRPNNSSKVKWIFKRQ
ncbi:MAG: hypothetical protein JST34_15835 [Bacteroidetes bacterium]|nr:hypothetical protein [Bacteroidota bacterium]